MTESELIKKIRQLSEIKPRKDWVLLTKSRILGLSSQPEREKISVFTVLKGLFFQPRMAFVLPVVLGLFIAAFTFAQNSLPGDLLYPLKRIAEKGQALFVSEAERPTAQLELANRRLEELTKIAEQNQTPKLAPALDEFQKSAAVAAQNLKKPQKITREVVDETKKFLENKEKAEASLGAAIGGEELDDALSQTVENAIKELEKQTPTENQEKLLKEAKEDFSSGNLTGALDKISQMNLK